MASVSHDPYCESQRFTEHNKKPKFFLLFPLLFKEINKRRISPRLPETLFFFVCYLNLEKIFENINTHRCTVVKRKQTNATHMPRELFFFFFFSPCIGTASSRGWIFVLWWIFFFYVCWYSPKSFPAAPEWESPGASGPEHSYSNDIVSFPSVQLALIAWQYNVGLWPADGQRRSWCYFFFFFFRVLVALERKEEIFQFRNGRKK